MKIKKKTLLYSEQESTMVGNQSQSTAWPLWTLNMDRQIGIEPRDGLLIHEH